MTNYQQSSVKWLWKLIACLAACVAIFELGKRVGEFIKVAIG